jgi:hypothetical protein
MIICSEGHREITWDNNETDKDGIYLTCPLCDVIAEVKRLREGIEKHKEIISKYFTRGTSADEELYKLLEK